MNRIRLGSVVAQILVVVLATGLTGLLTASTVHARFERDVSRIVFNDNLELLEDVRLHAGAADDSLLALLEGDSVATPEAAIVISITDNKLWYRVQDSVVFETRVATGSGKVLVKGPGGSRWKFETPRGRLKVLDKDEDPDWVPPDWHFVEEASKRGVRLTKLLRGQSVDAGDGTSITVVGSDVVRRYPDGRTAPLEASSGREIVVNGQMIVRAYVTFDITNRNKLALGMVSFAVGVPMLIVAPFGGVIADRVEKRRLIMAGQSNVT